MPVITIDLSQEQIDRAQELADKLTAAYGTKVSRASVIRRAIMAFEPLELVNFDDKHNRPSITPVQESE